MEARRKGGEFRQVTYRKKFCSIFTFHKASELLKFQNRMDTLSQRENVCPLIPETSVTSPGNDFDDWLNAIFAGGPRPIIQRLKTKVKPVV